MEVRVSGFSVRVPPGYVRTDARGIDSEVAVFEGKSGSVLYDYGAFSNDLHDYMGATIASACETRLDGRPVRFVTGRAEQGGYFVAAHWPATQPGVALTITGPARDERSARLLHGVIRSVRFDGSANK
jgi:hypothetical protein